MEEEGLFTAEKQDKTAREVNVRPVTRQLYVNNANNIFNTAVKDLILYPLIHKTSNNTLKKKGFIMIFQQIRV